MSQSSWQDIRDRKLADITSRIPPEWLISTSSLPLPSTADVLSIPRTCGILTLEEIHITEAYTARRLLAALRNRALTAVEVTTAYCKRAAITNQLTSCLTEPLFHDALARASHLDFHLRTTGQPLGPLHGLPISVKDTFHITGYDSSVGIASLCHKPATSNAPLVQFLLDAGAIIHCKTNVPQTALAIDSVNYTFGRVLNPQNREEWTAGGSSGGEGVLVKMRGSVLGIGTDVGGSVRIPAMCNGLVGFKPSAGRVPTTGHSSGQLPATGKVGLEFAVGPIARCWDDVSVFFEFVEGARMWEVEHEVIPGRWWSDSNNDTRSSKRREKSLIGVIWRDGVTEPLPPVKRAMEEVVHKLRIQGIEVRDVDATRSLKACQPLANKFFTAEGYAHLFSTIESTGEPWIPWLASRIKRRAPASIDQLRDLMAQRVALQNEVQKMWKTSDDDDERDVDAIICPVAPHPLPGIDRWNTMNYTTSFVLLDYPAVSVPVSHVTREDLEMEMTGEVLGSWDKINRQLWDKKETNRTTYINSPLSIQIIAPRLEERRLFDTAVVITDALQKTTKTAKL